MSGIEQYTPAQALQGLADRGVPVKLVGEDGNAFFILARCSRAARRAGATEAELKAFHDEATAGDYNHLLRTVMAVFDCDGEDSE